MEIKSRKKMQIYKILAALVSTIFMVGIIPHRAYAYTSWVQDTESFKDFYNNASLSGNSNNQGGNSTEEEGFLSKQLGNLLHFNGWLAQEDLQSGNINLTIDGVVFGKLAQPAGISYTSFDLSDGNIYGIVGATIYTIFRGLSYSGMFIMFLYLLAKNLFSTSPKAKEDFKNGVYGILISFVLIYAMPQIVDIVIFIRDQVLYMIATKMLGSSNPSILDAMNNAYFLKPSLVRAIVYVATVFATFFYISKYISVAVQETVLFGFFCVFILLGTEKKKFLTDWVGVFFSNLALPLVDAVCLMLPYKAMEYMGNSFSFGESIIIVFMLWTANACSSLIMKQLGNMTGTPAGRGLGGIAMMGMAAMRSIGRAAAPSGRYAGNGGEEGYSEWKAESERQKDTAEEMNRQARDITRGIDSLDDVLENTSDESTPLSEEELHLASSVPQLGDGEDVLSEDEPGILGGEGIPDGLEQPPVSDIPDGAGQPGQASLEDSINTSEEMPPVEGAAEDMPNDEVMVEKPEEEAAGKDEDNEQQIKENPMPGQGDRDAALADPAAEDELPPMSDFDRKRYSNLKELDELNDDLLSDRRSLEQLQSDPDIEAKRNSIRELEDANSEIDRKINECSFGLRTETQNDDALRDLSQRSAAVGESMAAESRDLNALRDNKNSIDENMKYHRAILNDRSRSDGEKEISRKAYDDLIRRRNECDERIGEKVSSMENLRREKAELDRQFNTHKAGLEKTNQETIRDLKAQRSANAEKMKAERTELGNMERDRQSRAKKLQSAIDQKEAVIEQRRAAERQFAQVSRDHGRDGASYGSAKDMKLAMETRNANNLKALEAAKNRANMSIRDLRGLSPETAAEVAEIQRNNIQKANIQRAVKNTVKTAGVTAATIAGATFGAAAAAYGGQDASVSGAMIGGMIAGGTARSAADAHRRFVESSEETNDILMEAGEKVQNAYLQRKGKKKDAGVKNAHKKGMRPEATAGPAENRIQMPGSPNMEEAANRAYREKKKNVAEERAAETDGLTMEEVKRRTLDEKRKDQ